jgi:hypothetical protein
MKGGVRGKYVQRIREGTNIVLIEPEVSEAFPTEKAVNEALKGVLNTTRAVRNTGGLPNRSQGAARGDSRLRNSCVGCARASVPGSLRAVGAHRRGVSGLVRGQGSVLGVE